MMYILKITRQLSEGIPFDTHYEYDDLKEAKEEALFVRNAPQTLEVGIYECKQIYKDKCTKN